MFCLLAVKQKIHPITWPFRLKILRIFVALMCVNMCGYNRTVTKKLLNIMKTTASSNRVVAKVWWSICGVICKGMLPEWA